MDCPHWHLDKLHDLPRAEGKPATLGHATYRCGVCKELFTVKPMEITGRLGQGKGQGPTKP